MSKQAFIDLETTDLDPVKGGIHHIAGIIVIDGEEKETFNYHVQPFASDVINDEALKIAKITRENLVDYLPPAFVHFDLTQRMKEYVNKFDSSDKFQFLGYNSPFDNQFLREWFKKCEDNYFGSWFWSPDVCVMRKAADAFAEHRHKFVNFKLQTVYRWIFGKEFEAHDALADIRATKEIYDYLKTYKPETQCQP